MREPGLKRGDSLYNMIETRIQETMVILTLEGKIRHSHWTTARHCLRQPDPSIRNNGML